MLVVETHRQHLRATEMLHSYTQHYTSMVMNDVLISNTLTAAIVVQNIAQFHPIMIYWMCERKQTLSAPYL